MLKSQFDFKLAVGRIQWTFGEFVHRRFDPADKISSQKSRVPLPESPLTSSTVPPYPYARTTSEPLQLSPIASISNPILKATDVTDYGAVDFLADPFLFPADTGGWHLFFEIFNPNRQPTGVIGHAMTDDAGQSWQYNGIVLRTDVHLAFPYVFKWDGSYYMVPDRWSREDPAAIRIYRTDSLPDGWQPISTIVDPDRQLADCVVFRWNGRWWALLGSDDEEYDLELYHSHRLIAGDWTPHEQNPVVTRRPEAARPAGRPIVRDDKILIFFQDCAAQYGDKVRAFEISHLSRSAYQDREHTESPVLEASERRVGWNSGRMHHIDPWYTSDGWRCAVDGDVGFGNPGFGRSHWAIGLYRA